MSKGSHRRPRAITEAEMTRRWALAFGGEKRRKRVTVTDPPPGPKTDPSGDRATVVTTQGKTLYNFSKVNSMTH